MPKSKTDPEIFDIKRIDPKIVSWFDDRFYKIDYDKLPPEVMKKYPDKKGIDFLPSVTTVLGAAPKEWLSKWRGQVGNWEADRVMNEAATKGEHVHHAANVLATGGTIIFNNLKAPAYTPEEMTALIAENPYYYVLTDQQEALEVSRIAEWFRIVKPQIVASEVKVFSLAYDYAGTVDLIVDIEFGSYPVNCTEKQIYKGRYIIDYKSGVQNAESYSKQLAAYMVAFEEFDTPGSISGTINIYTNTSNKKEIVGLKTEVYSREETLKAFNSFLNVKAVYDDHLDYKPKVLDLPTIINLRGCYDN